jgi:site-specific DNA recombinase
MEQKIVGIWIRVSTEDQARGESPEHHEKRAKLYAEAKGWHVEEVYHLEAVSGKAVMEHPEAKRMLKDITAGHITGLIFSKLARLARNTKQLLDFADFFDKHNADLISLGESIDTSTPAGRLFYTVIAATTQFEREEIASRVAASIPIRAQLGKPLSGHSPYGFRWVDKKFVVDENEAPVLKLMFDLFLKHKRKKTVADELNQMGYRTRAGALFSGTAIRRALLDTAAKGIRRANYLTSKNGKSIPKPESDWVFLPCEPIVSPEVWDNCHHVLMEQLKPKKKPGPKAVHLLSGFVKCTCGKKMYVFHENKLLYACAPCKNRIPADDLHDIYYEQLKTFLLTETDVSAYLSKTNAEITEKEKQCKLLNDEAIALRKRKTELINLRIANELTKETFAEQFKPMEAHLAQIDEQLPQLEAEIDFLKIQNASSDTVLQEAKDLYTRWPTLAFEQKRGIVEIITDSITVGTEDISIKLAYMPTPPSRNPVNSAQTLIPLPVGISLLHQETKLRKVT